MAYAIIRTDLMSGTVQPADLVSVRFYNAEGKHAEVENGVIVKLQGYEEGEREVMKAVVATASDDMNDCAVLANPEVMYDERKHNLEDYINEAGKAVRAYIPRSRNMFSLTAEGFVNAVAPEVGAEVGIGAGGKLSASATGFGKCVHTESAGRHTYYTIMIGKTENAAENTENT